MNKLKKLLLYTILIIIALVFLSPLFYAMYNSFLPLELTSGIVTDIRAFTLDNYIELLRKHDVLLWFKNTVVMTSITVGFNLIINTMAGYALAKLNFPGKKVIFLCVLMSLMIPFQLILTPLYIQVARFKMIDTMAGLTVPFLFSVLYVFLSRQFFLTIPDELEEAARVDGMTRIGAFFRIILPISGPSIGVTALLSFVTSWNAYLVPATFTTSPKNHVLVVGLNTLGAKWFDRVNLTMAGVVITTVPIIIIYLLLQKYFVEGIATTGVKG